MPGRACCFRARVASSCASLAGAAVDRQRAYRPSLLRRGLVHREADPGDGRSILVTLSEQGRIRVDAAITRLMDAEAELLRTLSAAERTRLAALLRHLSLGFESGA